MFLVSKFKKIIIELLDDPEIKKRIDSYIKERINEQLKSLIKDK